MNVCEILNVNRADFLFAFNDEFHVQGKLSPHLLDGVDRGDSGGKIAFVVGNASSPDAAILDFTRPWLVLPQIERLGGLDIIVVVKGQGFRGNTRMFAIDDRETAS